MALNDYLCTHPKLRDEIENQMGVVQGIEEPKIQLQSMEGDCCNDSDVPSHLVIQKALGLTVSTDPEEAVHCVLQVKQDKDRNLVAGSESENIGLITMGDCGEIRLQSLTMRNRVLNLLQSKFESNFQCHF